METFKSKIRESDFTTVTTGRNGEWHSVNYDQLEEARTNLVDQLFNSSEKRLARALLMLAHFGKEGVPESVVPRIS